MRKLFTILTAVAVAVGVGVVPAGAATRSPDRHPKSTHPKHDNDRHNDRHNDRDRDRDRHATNHDHDRDRRVTNHDRDRDRHVNDGDHDRDDRHFKDRDHDRDRDRRRFNDRRHNYYYYHYHYYYPYYGYYGDDYYNDYYYDRYYYDGYYDRYYRGGYGYRDCDQGPPPDGVVVIRCFAFTPARIYVGVGRQVVWSWQDRGTPHTVTADDGSFDSGRRTDGEVRLTFSHPGQYDYHCSIHPQMTGSVIVG
jgi:hypothetical protein